jgi:hypothetical protein
MIRRSDVAAPSLRVILTGLIEYEHTYKTYPPTLSALGGPTSGTPSAKHAELIDDLLAAGLKSGYVYRYKPIDTWRSGRFDAFTVIADPLATEGTKQRHYFVDQTGVIRVETDRPATTGSPPSDSVPY